MQLITLDPEEFNEVAKRVHEFLLNRAQRAQEKKRSHPSKRTNKKHIEAAKDVFVFIHMMEMIEHMSAEIGDLRDMLSGLDPDDHSPFPEIFKTKKTNFLN